MKFSTNFIKTKREVSSEIESVNGKLLTKAGYIHQEMAGAYTFLPLGVRVLSKIENIVRKHMDEIASEMLMTSLHPKSLWETTKRIDSVDVLFKASGANKPSIERNSAEYILAPTHEDMVTPLMQESVLSYKDLPQYVYQIQTKFRNEARAKSGIMRGREFRMKDLYSFNKSEEDLKAFYEVAKKKYVDIFNELGIGADTFLTLASGGDFTKNYSHEFQLLLDSGEDIIYLDRANKIAYNKEINTPEDAKKLGIDFSKLEEIRASEIGNIFPLGTKYSDAFDFNYIDVDGSKKKVWMGSYGIGTSRIMGVIVEKFHDDKGIIWPAQIAPFNYHLISICKDKDSEVFQKANELYEKLQSEGKEVLWDDRFGVNPGEKFNDADLIGIPVRLVISERTLKEGKIEKKMRNSENTEMVSIESDQF
ncbi:MAG: aminoacyl--tRNA ligase-related protein [bacterium]